LGGRAREMTKVAMSIGATLAITYVVAFSVYGAASSLIGLQPPSGVCPGEFLLSVLVVKLGLAVGFVPLFWLARRTWTRRWPLYALVWWGTFAITEIGQAIGPNYSWLEAAAGITAEAVYCPLAALVTAKLLGTTERDAIAA
jgi:hypothetical protein